MSAGVPATGRGIAAIVQLLRGAIRTYACGSRSAIAEFTGRPTPTAHPEAELWLGAHPGDPAHLQWTPVVRRHCRGAIGADPQAQRHRGAGPVRDVLPFLVKVLAADEPLSLQAHPSAEQALPTAGQRYRRGVPLNSPMRNYRDRSHKPELLVALSDFEAAGRLSAARLVDLMRALEVPGLEPFIGLLEGQADAPGLRALFTTWITAPQAQIDSLIPMVLEGAVAYIRSGAKEFAAESRAVLELGERYPGDAGVLAALLLNRISLKCGEGIFPSAGNCTAIRRAWPWAMAGTRQRPSRVGLRRNTSMCPNCFGCWTSKPVTDARVRTTIDGIELTYDTPTAEFAGSVLTFDGEHLGHEVDAPCRHEGPQILVCTEGSVVVRSKSDEVRMQRGSAAWVAADDGPIRVEAAHPGPTVPHHGWNLTVRHSGAARQIDPGRSNPPARATPGRRARRHARGVAHQGLAGDQAVRCRPHRRCQSAEHLQRVRLPSGPGEGYARLADRLVDAVMGRSTAAAATSMRRSWTGFRAFFADSAADPLVASLLSGSAKPVADHHYRQRADHHPLQPTACRGISGDGCTPTPRTPACWPARSSGSH